MRKIRASVLRKVEESRLTNKELTVFLHICHSLLSSLYPYQSSELIIFVLQTAPHYTSPVCFLMLVSAGDEWLFPKVLGLPIPYTSSF